MLEIYAWLTSRYDNSHDMRESARGWYTLGGVLTLLGGGPLLIGVALASVRSDGKIFMAIFPALPQWAALSAYVALVVGCYTLAYGVVLSRAAKWARRCYHL